MHDQNYGLILMTFDEKSQKLPQAGIDRISATASDRPSEPPLNGLILMIFDEKSRKIPETGSDRIWVTASDRASGIKEWKFEGKIEYLLAERIRRGDKIWDDLIWRQTLMREWNAKDKRLW
jgi:hypothetical protein